MRRLHQSTPIDAIAFDFDGTLADTAQAIVTTVQQTLAELDRPALPRHEVVQRMGLPLADVFVAGGVAPDALTHAVARYRELFAANTDSIVLFEGVLPCLEALATSG